MPKLAQFFSASALVLDRQSIAARGLDPTAVQEEGRWLLLQEEGVAVAYTRAELESGQRAGAPHFDANAPRLAQRSARAMCSTR